MQEIFQIACARLTTLTVLLKAISKQMADVDSTRAKEIDSLLVKGDDLSLLLLQTNHDSSHIFIDYLRDGTLPANKPLQTSADQNLVNAIAECETFVAGWAQKSRTFVDLFGIIKNRLSVIFHEIEDEALVYTVFEVLNSRGLDVTWFDKLKSLLMAIVFEHGDRGSRKETVAELHNLWTEVYRTIGLRWQSLNRETVRFAGTLRVNKSPNRPLGEEDAVQVLSDSCQNEPKKVVDCTKWLLKVTQAEARILGDHRLRAATQIVQARLAAIAIILRKFPQAEEKKILKVWESVTFRIYGLGRRDSRTKVGDYVRLAWRVVNENLSPEQIINELKAIGQEFQIDTVLDGLKNSDCYQGWTEQLRYFFYRYEEHLASDAGQILNETQWNRIWADEPSKSVEHIYAQSKGSWDPKTKGIFVHRLGNLMMLPPGVNSKLQDDAAKDKAATYNTCGLLGAIEVGKAIKADKWDYVEVAANQGGYVVPFPSNHLLSQPIQPSQLVRKPVTSYRIAIGSIDVHDPNVLDDYLQEPGMTVGVVSDESLSNGLHRMARENRNSVIGFLRNRHTFIAERFKCFGRELGTLQFLEEKHIRFANLQPCCDMGQPRANRIQIPTGDFKHEFTF